ncbi:MAG: hypothetical protein OEM00_10170 [Burkholderiaceae bacterium]|nr:hypothetical protein [Burkholderiaceae bacterium]
MKRNAQIQGRVERPEAEPETDDNGQGRIMMRPDGYHWIALDGKNEFGPFATFELALADMNAADDEAPAPAETLPEAEAEIGISDWIDPATGEPAEGQSPPHLRDE